MINDIDHGTMADTTTDLIMVTVPYLSWGLAGGGGSVVVIAWCSGANCLFNVERGQQNQENKSEGTNL